MKVGFLLLLLLPDRDQTCVRWEQSLNHQRAREVPKLPLQVLSLLSLEEFSKKGRMTFVLFLAMPCILWGLSSPTGDRTQAPYSGSAES